LRLARLTGLERDKIQADLTEVATQIPRFVGDSRVADPPHGGDDEELIAARKEIVSPE